MPRRCSICVRPDAGTINAALAEGRSARSVALEHGLSEDALQRHHAASHGARHTAVPPASPLPDHPLDELVDALRPHALTGDPQVAHQYRLALSAQADARNAAPPTRDLATEPEWLELRARLMAVLEPFPDATRAVIKALS